MHFDFLYGNDLGFIDQTVFYENTVLLTAVFTFQKVGIPILRHAGVGFAPFVRQADMFSVIF